ncbi:g3320 [Coccomyxa elongata]
MILVSPSAHSATAFQYFEGSLRKGRDQRGDEDEDFFTHRQRGDKPNDPHTARSTYCYEFGRFYTISRLENPHNPLEHLS